MRVLDPFISLSHSDNQSESSTKLYNSKADVWGNVLTLISYVLRSDRIEPFWMPTKLVKFPVHSLRLLRDSNDNGQPGATWLAVVIFFFSG